MAKPRHVAIASQNADTSPKYFVDIFDMEIRDKIDNRNAKGYYLTDGTVNAAILKFKNAPTGGCVLDCDGLQHIEFEMENLDAVAERRRAAGYKPRHDVNIAQGLGANPSKDSAEIKLTGPNRLMINISQRGCVGASRADRRANDT
jgi:glyoxylase I family protein